MTYDEVQDLFDAADGRGEEIRARQRKGALTALRGAMLLKTSGPARCGLIHRGRWALRDGDHWFLQ
ncbi:hypothetical protein [Streptomyces inhibens]|uniref:hypothetical protein n=1 Tax=Streptomyces inhibens TaxID=2293571 RepID=UPI001FD31419|nr:hypothetical protein [Streptomyces inhibens]